MPSDTAAARPSAAQPPLAPGPGAFQPDFATSPDFFTRMTRLEKGRSGSPHNLVRIYYSKNLEPAVDLSSFDAPVGTVAIKEQDRDGEGGIDNVLDMVKQPTSYDPANHDWLYEVRAPDGTLQESGKNSFCIGCHQGFSATDYLAGTMLHGP
jgi:hypothetical protein